jgi:hypothetical protein
MSIGQWVGVALVAIGVAEYVLFRALAPRREDIRRRMPLLVANSALNVVVGLGLLVLL